MLFLAEKFIAEKGVFSGNILNRLYFSRLWTDLDETNAKILEKIRL